MKKAELVLIPGTAISHILPIISFAKRLLDQDDRFSITVLVMNPPFDPDVKAYSQSHAASHPKIRYINISQDDNPISLEFARFPEEIFSAFIESQKHHVKNAIINHVELDSLVGLVVDLLCTIMIDVANELGVPSYLFSPCNAALLGTFLHLPTQYTELHKTDTKLVIPSFVNPVPSSVLPSFLLTKDGYMWLQNHASKYRQTKGIIINTFVELESHAINSFDDSIPPVYTVGPLLDLIKHRHSQSNDEILKWLDDQPPQSVVFLCFGSMGAFGAPQVKEIARGLEHSGYRFIWSIRRPPPKNNFAIPSEYENDEQIFQDGFLERTKGRGMICGWAPQAQILAHKAIGGFVTHSGWNSFLESLWYGVPIAAWPMYGDQHINSFEIVRELGLAVELKLDYKMGDSEIVMADVIEEAVKCLMKNDNSEVRMAVKEMSQKSKKALMDNGSSFSSFGRLVEVMLGNHKS